MQMEQRPEILCSLLHAHTTLTGCDGIIAGLTADAGGNDRSAASLGMLTADL